MIVISPTAVKLLADLAENSIELDSQGDKIRYRPRQSMTPALLQRLQTQKAELLDLFKTETVTKLRQSIASLWKDPVWHSAWERRFQMAQHANLASLRCVLKSIVDGRRNIIADANGTRSLRPAFSLFVWHRVNYGMKPNCRGGQFSLDLTDHH